MGRFLTTGGTKVSVLHQVDPKLGRVHASAAKFSSRGDWVTLKRVPALPQTTVEADPRVSHLQHPKIGH